MNGLTELRRARLLKAPRKKTRLALLSMYGGFAHKRSFRDVETFCIFIGYRRSGHTLIASLLDAHPNAIFADELNALRFVEAGFNKSQLLYLLWRNSRKSAAAGRERTGYSYQVPDQWQGRFKKLQVIGDKMGGDAALRLKSHPSLLESLQQLLQLKTKFIHVMRNPYDIISTDSLRRRVPLQRSIDDFFQLCGAVAYVKSRVMPSKVYDIRHEEFIADPTPKLQTICDFLCLNRDNGYYEACASIVFNSPHRSRHEILWPDNLIEATHKKLKEFDFFSGYTFEK